MGSMPFRRASDVAVGLALTALVTGLGAEAATTQPPANRILAVNAHSTEKAKQLARRHDRALRALNAEIYHCLPWLDVEKEGIGFFKPKDAPDDERYLSLRVFIEQDASPQFAQLSQGERIAAMFSRYVGTLLRRMAADPGLRADPNLDGFSVILDWKRPGPGGERPVNETIAVFVKAPVVATYVTGQRPIAELSEEARVLGWDGETPLGPFHLRAWEDDFVASHKVANHEPQKGVTCPR
jgi:hypothetical protein